VTFDTKYPNSKVSDSCKDAYDAFDKKTQRDIDKRIRTLIKEERKRQREERNRRNTKASGRSTND
jgi:hypothetical protein